LFNFLLKGFIDPQQRLDGATSAGRNSLYPIYFYIISILYFNQTSLSLNFKKTNIIFLENHFESKHIE